MQFQNKNLWSDRHHSNTITKLCSLLISCTHPYIPTAFIYSSKFSVLTIFHFPVSFAIFISYDVYENRCFLWDLIYLCRRPLYVGGLSDRSKYCFTPIIVSQNFVLWSDGFAILSLAWLRQIGDNVPTTQKSHKNASALPFNTWVLPASSCPPRY